MNMINTNAATAATRLTICAVLFAIWMALVIYRVPGDEQIIDVIKYTLAMLGGYHAGDRINAQATSADPAPDLNIASQPKE
jgi:hypothetical protein